MRFMYSISAGHVHTCQPVRSQACALLHAHGVLLEYCSCFVVRTNFVVESRAVCTEIARSALDTCLRFTHIYRDAYRGTSHTNNQHQRCEVYVPAHVRQQLKAARTALHEAHSPRPGDHEMRASASQRAATPVSPIAKWGACAPTSTAVIRTDPRRGAQEMTQSSASAT